MGMNKKTESVETSIGQVEVRELSFLKLQKVLTKMGKSLPEGRITSNVLDVLTSSEPILKIILEDATDVKPDQVEELTLEDVATICEAAVRLHLTPSLQKKIQGWGLGLRVVGTNPTSSSANLAEQPTS